MKVEAFVSCHAWVLSADLGAFVSFSCWDISPAPGIYFQLEEGRYVLIRIYFEGLERWPSGYNTCSSRGPGLNSQPPYSASQPSVAAVLEKLMPLSGF